MKKSFLIFFLVICFLLCGCSDTKNANAENEAVIPAETEETSAAEPPVSEESELPAEAEATAQNESDITYAAKDTGFENLPVANASDISLDGGAFFYGNASKRYTDKSVILDNTLYKIKGGTLSAFSLNDRSVISEISLFETEKGTEEEGCYRFTSETHYALYAVNGNIVALSSVYIYEETAGEDGTIHKSETDSTGIYVIAADGSVATAGQSGELYASFLDNGLLYLITDSSVGDLPYTVLNDTQSPLASDKIIIPDFICSDNFTFVTAFDCASGNFVDTLGVYGSRASVNTDENTLVLLFSGFTVKEDSSRTDEKGNTVTDTTESAKTAFLLFDLNSGLSVQNLIYTDGFVSGTSSIGLEDGEVSFVSQIRNVSYTTTETAANNADAEAQGKDVAEGAALTDAPAEEGGNDTLILPAETDKSIAVNGMKTYNNVCTYSEDTLYTLEIALEGIVEKTVFNGSLPLVYSGGRMYAVVQQTGAVMNLGSNFCNTITEISDKCSVAVSQDEGGYLSLTVYDGTMKTVSELHTKYDPSVFLGGSCAGYFSKSRCALPVENAVAFFDIAEDGTITEGGIIAFDGYTGNCSILENDGELYTVFSDNSFARLGDAG